MSEEWKVVKSVNVGRELNLNLPLEWTVAVVGVMVKLLFLIQNCISAMDQMIFRGFSQVLAGMLFLVGLVFFILSFVYLYLFNESTSTTSTSSCTSTFT